KSGKLSSGSLRGGSYPQDFDFIWVTCPLPMNRRGLRPEIATKTDNTVAVTAQLAAFYDLISQLTSCPPQTGSSSAALLKRLPSHAKRYHPRRRLRHSPAPDYAGNQQATVADLRQADGVLPFVDIDVGRNSRDPRYLNPQRSSWIPTLA